MTESFFFRIKRPSDVVVFVYTQISSFYALFHVFYRQPKRSQNTCWPSSLYCLLHVRSRRSETEKNEKSHTWDRQNEENSNKVGILTYVVVYLSVDTYGMGAVQNEGSRENTSDEPHEKWTTHEWMRLMCVVWPHANRMYCSLQKVQQVPTYLLTYLLSRKKKKAKKKQRGKWSRRCADDNGLNK